MDDETEITVQELGRALASPEGDFMLLDVRQGWELELAKIDDPRLVTVPMNRIVVEVLSVLPPPGPDHTPVYVLCHHGIRSATVVRWLRQQGWDNTFNIQGGLERFAEEVDSDVGSY
ncbi:MAG: rhodanese-like domain-containing protein [Anaerolineales bacterium]